MNAICRDLVGPAAFRAGCTTAVAIVALVSVAPACATSWWLPSTVGYGGVGAGIAALAVVSSDSQSLGPTGGHVAAMLLLTGAGVAAGAAIGATADKKLFRGEALSGGHRMAVRAGTVLAGGTTGLVVGAFMISSDDDTRETSDEEIIARSVAAGLLGGVVVQFLLDSHLDPKRSVSLAAAPLQGGGGGVGVGAEVSW